MGFLHSKYDANWCFCHRVHSPALFLNRLETALQFYSNANPRGIVALMRLKELKPQFDEGFSPMMGVLSRTNTRVRVSVDKLTIPSTAAKYLTAVLAQNLGGEPC
jgi:hypothetical protein